MMKLFLKKIVIMLVAGAILVFIQRVILGVNPYDELNTHLSAIANMLYGGLAAFVAFKK